MLIATDHPDLFAALQAAGLADGRTRRVVLDLPLDAVGPITAYIERYGDERVIDVISTLAGVEIRYVPDEEGST